MKIMKKNCLLLVLSILVLLASSFLVQGQYASHTDASKAASNNSQYSQYYIFPAPQNPKTQATAPEQFDIENNTPNAVHFSYLMQPVPYSQYEPVMHEGNSLWIQGDKNWTQYAVVPQGAVVPILAISQAGGVGDIVSLIQQESRLNTIISSIRIVVCFSTQIHWDSIR
jgi:hypothetical protein